jgi:hypothetical protein
MNRNYFGKNVLLKSAALGVALICCAEVSHAKSKEAAPAPASTEATSPITVKRRASVGSGVDIDLSIDGKRVKTLIQGSTYRGTIAVGKHTVSVSPKPNTTGQSEVKLDVNVEKGQALNLSVAHDKTGKLVLEKS